MHGNKDTIFSQQLPHSFSLISDAPGPVQSPPTAPSQSGVRASAGEAASIREYPAPGHRIKAGRYQSPDRYRPPPTDFMRTPYLAFYFLGEMKHGQRRKKRFHAGRRIQKRMFRRKAPRSSSMKKRTGKRLSLPALLFSGQRDGDCAPCRRD